MKFSDLPDIDFVTADKDAVQSVILSIYKSVTGRQLAQGGSCPAVCVSHYKCGYFVTQQNQRNWAAELVEICRRD